MSAAPKPIGVPAPVPRKPALKLARPDAYLQGAIEAMARVHAERGRAIFALTSANKGAGTTYIVNLLAQELVRQFDCTVAIVGPDALKGADPKQLPQGFIEESPHVWSAVADKALAQMPDFALENIWISRGAQNFDFVLIDCPSLASNSQTVRWANTAHGVFLIVEAGVTKRYQIESATRTLQATGSHLQGIILNRRTYPIPKALYKLL
jgi:hypothetical protein